MHISELNWSLVEDPRDLYKTGDKVRAKIIEVKDDKISSVKALKPNPWHEAEKNGNGVMWSLVLLLSTTNTAHWWLLKREGRFNSHL